MKEIKITRDFDKYPATEQGYSDFYNTEVSPKQIELEESGLAVTDSTVWTFVGEESHISEWTIIGQIPYTESLQLKISDKLQKSFHLITSQKMIDNPKMLCDNLARRVMTVLVQEGIIDLIKISERENAVLGIWEDKSLEEE